ncbi:MAG: CofH family radical SAM protein [Bacteroidota bacterium]
MNKEIITFQIGQMTISDEIKSIANKIIEFQRISKEECQVLYQCSDLPLLGILANYANKSKNKNQVFFNRNFHVEPSNVCRYNCKFCSYRKEASLGYTLTKEEILIDIRKHYKDEVTEVHIVGSAHPERGLEFYEDLLRSIKKEYPRLHIKAFSAIELYSIFELSKVSIIEGLTRLKNAGLQSIPGGGAEIFDETIRKQICNDKADAKFWLEIHKTAHQLGLSSNATMLYGHIESYENRVDHLDRLRSLQDETNGFNAFIPLKFLHANNEMSNQEESSIVEDMKNFAVARIFLDNFQHIKSYWPMLGKEEASLALNFGADDMDGTIDDTTTIYTTAGSKEQSPKMTSEELISIIHENNRVAVERDSKYNVIKLYPLEINRR